MIHYFLAELASEVDLVPGLERVTIVGIDPDGRVLLMKSLISVRVNVYSTQRRLFACLGELPSEGPPPGGGYPCRGLRVTALRLRCASSQPRHLPWGDLPARLADEDMQEGREVGRDGVH